MKRKNKVLLIGWDAADWKIIGPLLAKGHMPALKKLIDKGVYGNMSTMNPPFSPMLWSTVATGKTPDKHGVLGFIEIVPNMKGIRPVTVNSRKSKAIWNILHNQGYKSNIVGWWPSFPAEPINGVIVSDRYQKVKKDPKEKTPLVQNTIHPKSFVKELRNLRMFPYEVTDAHILPFIPNAGLIDQEKDKGLNPFAKVLAENVSVHNAATNLMRTTEWDFMAVYYDMIDHFCHAYMKFHPPKLEKVPDNFFTIYKDVVKGAYRFQDMMLERMMDLAGEDTNIIIMSDHGFESGHRRLLEMPKYPSAPALEHRQFGMFVAAGPNIKKNEKVFGLGLIDIAPTILHLFDLPIGKDMDGKVALDIFKEIKEPKYIESWEDVKGDFGQHENINEVDQLSDQETMEQLIELGYIDRPDQKIETAILKTKCDIKHNLARVYLGKKDFEKAKKILLELLNDEYPVLKEGDKLKDDQKVGDSVIDIIPYYMDLLTVSLQEKDYNIAETYLNKLKTLNSTFRLNTYFSEAAILLGKGEVQKALEILQSAKDRNPNSEVWYQIGKIYLKLDQFEEARHAIEKAIEFETDKAKFHQTMAVILIRLGEYEEAVEYALTSIELVKYFPEAHFVLGEALEKMGDIENAKKAFETASKLKPVEHHRATIAIEDIDEKLSESLTPTDKSKYKYRKDQIVIVSGLPRSGTSVMMQMINKGGGEVLIDETRKADESNPRGYFEYNPVKSIHNDNSWLESAKDKTVKIVAPLLKFLSPKYRYKVIFMNRNIDEIVKSQQKMIGKDPDTLPVSLIKSYKKQLQAVEEWKNRQTGVELIYVNYIDVLNNTDEAINKVTSFIGVDMNKDEMLKCVDRSLYRNKVESISK
jgi:predicted AlkP superfamily phosphohydrolase/phosphomutase/tetratricopeptide (TPR) repeat protein